MIDSTMNNKPSIYRSNFSDYTITMYTLHKVCQQLQWTGGHIQIQNGLKMAGSSYIVNHYKSSAAGQRLWYHKLVVS